MSLGLASVMVREFISLSRPSRIITATGERTFSLDYSLIFYYHISEKKDKFFALATMYRIQKGKPDIFPERGYIALIGADGCQPGSGLVKASNF